MPKLLGLGHTEVQKVGKADGLFWTAYDWQVNGALFSTDKLIMSKHNLEFFTDVCRGWTAARRI